MTADKIRKLVAKFLKELSSKTNPSLLVFLCSWFVLLSEETTRAWMFMRELKYVTDPELINQYKEAEVRREEWFEANGWFTPKVERDKLTLLSYDSVVESLTEQNRGTQDAFVKFLDTPEGPCRTADYDTTICGALPGAFGSRTTFSIIEKYESVQISVNGSTTILDDGINSTAKSAGQSSKKVSLNKFKVAVQHSSAAGCQECCSEVRGCAGEEWLAEAVTVRPGDAVVRLEAGHLGFNCISGQQWCDRHPQPFRSSGCY
jgi:hypothetical protein